MNDLTLDDIDGDGATISTDENGLPIVTRKDTTAALEALKSVSATTLLGGRRAKRAADEARRQANMPRKNTPKAERKTPVATAVTTPVTAAQLGHAPRPRKAKR